MNVAIRNKRTAILLLLFLTLMIIGHFYNPWGNEFDNAFEETFQLEELGFNFFENQLFNAVLFGIMDCLKLFAYSFCETINFRGVNGFDELAFFIPTISIAFFYGSQMLLEKIQENYIGNTDNKIVKFIDTYLVENIVMYVFYCVLFFVIEVTKKVLVNLSAGHEEIAAILAIVGILVALIASLVFMIVILCYCILMSIPFFVMELLLGISTGTVVGTLVFIILEIAALALWREYLCNYVMKASIRIVKFLVK